MCQPRHKENSFNSVSSVSGGRRETSLQNKTMDMSITLRSHQKRSLARKFQETDPRPREQSASEARDFAFVRT